MSESRNGNPSGADLYKELGIYARSRHATLTAMFRPVLEVTAAYGTLVAEVVGVLGAIKPKSKQDEVVRDLLADVFDFLWEWERPLMEGRPNVAFPLARRAYESMSLLSVCMQDEKMATRWACGKEIGNQEVRKALAQLPFGEDEETLRSLYAFFSEGSHPNRSLVASRYLGDGNQFVLGSIDRPVLPLIALHCIHLLEMWFWFVATIGYGAKEAIKAHRAEYGSEYSAVAKRAREVGAWLNGEYNRLLDERLAPENPQG